MANGQERKAINRMVRSAVYRIVRPAYRMVRPVVV
jgi:hypothetical protein